MVTESNQHKLVAGINSGDKVIQSEWGDKQGGHLQRGLLLNHYHLGKNFIKCILVLFV